MDSKRRVALAQNRIQKGGRMQVMAHMIAVLNDMGIVPDIVTFKMGISKAEIKKHYGVDLQYRVREIFINPILPFEWNILFFNWISKRYLKGYDLIINHNNTSYLGQRKVKQLSYVHFPRKLRNIQKEKDMHFPEGKDKSMFSWATDPFLIGKWLYKMDTTIGNNECTIANSEFTKAAIGGQYNIEPEKIEVLYPPVDIEQKPFNCTNPKLVVSLGRFAKDKRQLEQIQIAEQLPDFQFSIIGFVNDSKYFDSCVAYIENRNIKNVQLYPNVELETRNKLLREATFFLHSLRNEPFGITTVQGLAEGCIPVVHDSGGQQEVVPIADLRYTSKDEAIVLFTRLAEKDAKDLQSMYVQLQQNQKNIQ